jgi:hypothetical protein
VRVRLDSWFIYNVVISAFSPAGCRLVSSDQYSIANSRCLHPRYGPLWPWRSARLLMPRHKRSLQMPLVVAPKDTHASVLDGETAAASCVCSANPSTSTNSVSRHGWCGSTKDYVSIASYPIINRIHERTHANITPHSVEQVATLNLEPAHQPRLRLFEQAFARLPPHSAPRPHQPASQARLSYRLLEPHRLRHPQL